MSDRTLDRRRCTNAEKRYLNQYITELERWISSHGSPPQSPPKRRRVEPQDDNQVAMLLQIVIQMLNSLLWMPYQQCGWCQQGQCWTHQAFPTAPEASSNQTNVPRFDANQTKFDTFSEALFHHDTVRQAAASATSNPKIEPTGLVKEFNGETQAPPGLKKEKSNKNDREAVSSMGPSHFMMDSEDERGDQVKRSSIAAQYGDWSTGFATSSTSVDDCLDHKRSLEELSKLSKVDQQKNCFLQAKKDKQKILEEKKSGGFALSADSKEARWQPSLSQHEQQQRALQLLREKRAKDFPEDCLLQENKQRILEKNSGGLVSPAAPSPVADSKEAHWQPSLSLLAEEREKRAEEFPDSRLAYYDKSSSGAPPSSSFKEELQRIADSERMKHKVKSPDDLDPGKLEKLEANVAISFLAKSKPGSNIDRLGKMLVKKKLNTIPISAGNDAIKELQTKGHWPQESWRPPVPKEVSEPPPKVIREEFASSSVWLHERTPVYTEAYTGPLPSESEKEKRLQESLHAHSERRLRAQDRGTPD